MATTQGTAIVWGTATDNLTGFTAAVSGGYTITGEDFVLEAEKVELKDRKGEIQTVYYYNRGYTLSMKCYPSGANADPTSTPVIGEMVTVTTGVDANDDALDQFNGYWPCDSVSKTRTHDGVVEFDITLIARGCRTLAEGGGCNI